MMEKDIKTVFDNYRDIVFGFFVNSLGDRELAKDLTQELFYKLCKREEGLPDIRDLNSYIYWMVQNMVIDHLRRAAHEKEYRENLIAAWKNTGTIAHSQKPEVDRLIDAEYFSELFDQLITDLTPQQKLIVTLSKKDGLSNQQIAQKLGLLPNTVKNHLHQALKTIRSEFNSNVGFPLLILIFILT